MDVFAGPGPIGSNKGLLRTTRWCGVTTSRSYTAAVYLTPDAPPQSGTSFWRDRVHGCRRWPDHPLEGQRLGSDEAVAAARSFV